jgi:hypothetical protein
VTATDNSQESVIAAMCAALNPYPWRGFTPEQFARWALAASDRQGLHEALVTVKGTTVGTWAPLDPADHDDARLPRVVEFLASHRWTEFRLPALCRSLLSVLAS